MRESRKKNPVKKSVKSGSAADKKENRMKQEHLSDPKNGGVHFGVPQGSLKVFAYILSFFPPCGFILGIVFFSQPEEEARHFGRVCMIYAGIGVFALCFCWGVAGIMRGLAGNVPSGGLVGGYY